jgi:1-phosphofructokinase
LIKIAKARGAKCILDAAGPALELGLVAGPFLIKPNHAEVEGLLKRPIATGRELLAAARVLLRMGSEQVLISLGARGALGLAGNEAWFAPPPAVRVRSSVGAGDTMVAAMAYAAIHKLTFRQAFQMAVAASAATVAMEGTKVADFAAVLKLIPHVILHDVGA